MIECIIDGYNWTEFPFREDPIQNRRICFNCWNMMHGTRKEPGCKVDGCKCICYEAEKEKNHQRSIASAKTKAINKLQRDALKDKENPLRVSE